MTMRQDTEYRAYVNTHDKLLQELDEIRLKLSRDALARSPQERLHWFKTMVRDADALAKSSIGSEKSVKRLWSGKSKKDMRHAVTDAKR